MEPRDGEKPATPGKPPTPEEEAVLRSKIAGGGLLTCPRCHAPLTTIPVPPRSDVAYVRNRVVLSCESCGFRVALDRK